MKKNFGLILAITLGLSALLLSVASLAGWVTASPFAQEERAVSPTLVSYQGNIWNGGIPYDGTGYFKFAIIDSELSLTWSNDGNDPPTTAVPLNVSNGLFSVNLGDTKIGMVKLDAAAFKDPTTFLQVWFSPTGSAPWTEMPEQLIAAVPYALQAQLAAEADTLEGYEASAFQLYVSGSCPPGQAIRDINSNGTVICEAVESKPVHSITTLESVNDVGRDNSITIGTDGLGLISYHDGTNGNLKVAHCKNIACTDYSTSTLDVSGTSNVGYGSSIAIGGDGLGIVSYYDGTNGYLKVAHCNDVACTSANVQTLYTGLGSVTFPGTSITIGLSGYAVISFKSTTANAHLIVRCANYTCSSYDLSAIDAFGDPGNYSSITLSNAGYAVAAYINHSDWSLRIAYLYLLNPEIKGFTTVDGTGNMISPSIIIGADGLPIISYINLSTGTLNIAHCSDDTCSTSAKTSISFTNPVGGTSINIGSDNLPVVSYINSSYNLIVLKCSSFDCSGEIEKTPVDYGLGTSLYRTSLTIGMDGYPLISYYDQVSGDLLVAHCSNTSCIPFFRGR